MTLGAAFRLIVVALIVSSIAYVFLLTPVASLAEPPIPDDEIRMMKLFDEYAYRYDHAGNDIIRDRIPETLDKALCELFPSTHVTGWVGKIDYVTLHSDGSGGIVVKLNENITLTTHQDRPPSAAITKSLETFNIGSLVVFSGEFYMQSKSECVGNVRLTASGRIHEPLLIFDFTSLEHLN